MTVTATPTVDASERVHLARAIALATQARGTTAPNPTVGCVLLRDGEVVGQGVTRPVGGAHAEVVALEQAGARAHGATALVTLEPCSHHGRTAPCTDALIAAGVRRVVHALPDPNPVAAGGAATLRAAGIDVVAAPEPFRSWVAGELEGFLTHVRHGRPHVTLKVAQTSDGATVAPRGRRWITGPLARRSVHRWRSAVDAVLVGSGTVLADDPGLDVRDVPLGDRPQPRPVVLDGRLRTPATARVVARGALVVTGPDPDAAVAARLRAAGADVVVVPTDAAGRLELSAALGAVGEAGIASVLAEPGATLGGALLDAGLVDRLVRHVGLDVGDGVARPIFGQDRTGWTTTRLGGAGRDLVWERVPALTGPTGLTGFTEPAEPIAPTQEQR